MTSYLIIADIAGQYNALLRLAALVPAETVKVSVGDMCDRGSQSREVFEYFMAGYGKDKLAVLGNHCHMMLDYLLGRRAYDRGTWFWNSGEATLESFPDREVPKAMIEWIDNLPLTIQIDAPSPDVPHLFISHAPMMYPIASLPENPTESEIFNIVWNREEPIPQEGFLQVFGYNSHWGLREFREPGKTTPYAICLDQSRTAKALTGYLYPEGKILQVPYVVDQDVNSEIWEE